MLLGNSRLHPGNSRWGRLSSPRITKLSVNEHITKYGLSPWFQGYRPSQHLHHLHQQQLSRPVSEVIRVDGETRHLAEPIIFYGGSSFGG